MFGLIKKDLLMTKGNLKIMAIIFIVFAFVAINGEGNFTFIPAFISVMAMMSTFSYDEYNKSDVYITTFPDGRKQAVKAKYLSTIIIVFIAIILTFVLSIIIGNIQGDINVEEIIATTVGCMAGVFLLQAILCPLIYKFGIEKSRIGIFIGIFGIVGIASILMKNGLTIQIPQSIITFLDQYWILLIPIFIVFILFVSYKVSEQIYLKKEF